MSTSCTRGDSYNLPRRAALAAGVALATLVLAWGPAVAQTTSAAAGSLQISGEVPHPLTLSPSEIAAMPHVSARATDHSGKAATYDGVPLTAILERAGVTFGATLRGPRLASYIVIDAADGYRAVFAIAELDSAFTVKQVLVVDRKDGAPLSADEGPLRVVVPDEKRPARWVHQVTGIRVLSAPPKS
ncbi:MAG TPA: molybdopterin-dependent oxidoreductase [Gemmatimonadaceae bacterium]|nr:molybdopterin-dependent oxidoreductase [Gemmatimonadaceae bacterium]